MNSLVVNKYYKNVTLKSGNDSEKNFCAECKHCVGKKISGNVGASTNFIKHLKVTDYLTIAF